MANGSKKQAETTYVLEMSKREASALCEALLAVNFYEGEGVALEAIYDELTSLGAEADECSFTIEDDEVIVTRGEEA